MKNLTRFASVMSILLFFVSCVPTSVKKVTLVNDFNKEDAQYVLSEGDNTITGQSFLKTRGGEVKTCSGSRVSLVPVNDYSTERMRHIYGSNFSGYTSYYNAKKIEFSNNNPGYFRLKRDTVCDAQGNFEFKNVPDGSYYITTSVVWEVPNQYSTSFEGGALMKKVTVSGGEEKKVYVLGN